MGIHCINCGVLLTRDEYFWFNGSCVNCEVCLKILAEEQGLKVKSPLYAYVMSCFWLRWIWYRFTAYMKISI